MIRYPKYKDSGVEWIGEIPFQWAIKRLKYISECNTSNVDKHSKEDENKVNLCNYTDVYKNDKIHSRMDFMSATASQSEIEKFQLRKDDVLITKDSETPDDIAIPAIVTEDIKNILCGYHLALIRSNNKYIIGTYLYYLFKSYRFNQQFTIAANGITRFGLSIDDVRNANISLPSPDEQSQIAVFLDHKTHQIDELIGKKRKLIDLLKEERTTLINHAVRKGLDPKVPMKDSGIEWAGAIPEHWGVKKIKYLSFLKSGDSITSELIGRKGDFPVFGGNGIRGYYTSYTHDGNYVLIGRQGALCGNINYALGKFWASEHAVVASLLDKTNIIWFGELLKTMNLNSYSQSAAQPGLAVDTIKNLRIPVPPIEEQNDIESFIQENTKRIESITDLSIKEIAFLNEYKTSLINEAVTGKIKVSDAI